MANPRLAVDFEGIDGHYTGYLIDGATITWSAIAPRGSVVVDRAVALSGPGAVKLAGDGDRVIGRLERVESDGVATVQDGGHTILPAGTAAAITNGLDLVGALLVAAPGYVKEVAAGGVNAGGHQIIDNTTSTAVKVRLNR